MDDKPVADKVVRRLIEDEMKQSYLGYSMSVIVGRALPDVRDGLKPVHRRILYTMLELGLQHNKPFKKSARIVGDCMGKFHPHGDLAIYNTLVRMAQDFSLRYPLVNGQGNFGSIDGDSPAAMRYTEARLKKIAEEMLEDIDKDTVDFVPNYDGGLKEPTILPGKIPNLLVNGSSGIAVGMATNIPPHNLKEVCAGAIAMIDDPEISDEGLMEHIPAPDFPTGGILFKGAGLLEAYRAGRGKVTVRARTEVEDFKNKQRIIVSEIPYQVNKAELIKQIADQVTEKRVMGITDIRDESDRDDAVRIVLELKSGAVPDVVLNQLFRHTRMQETFGIINLALVKNQPTTLSLKGLLSEFIAHRKEIVRRSTEYDLRQAEAHAHILEGLIICLDHLDDVVALIRRSKSPADAQQELISDYQMSERQAKAILEMRLSKLTGLEQESIRKDHLETLKRIEGYKGILASEQRILDIIKGQLSEISEKYGDERRTQIQMAEAETLEMEALVAPEDVVVTMTHAGYVKRLKLDTYKAQKRGGKGIIGAEAKEEDFVEKLFVANTHDYLLLFTNLGKVYWLKVFQIPEQGRYARGTPVANLVQLSPGEGVQAVIPVKEFDERFVFMATSRGTVKKTPLEDFSNPRKGGIIALNLSAGDELIGVKLTCGEDEIILATDDGRAIRFSEKDVRPMGRTATGVIGVRLKKENEVVGMTLTHSDEGILTVSENGYGKRTALEEYRMTGRGGVGVTNLKVTEKTGPVASVHSVRDDEEAIVITQKGIVIRMRISDISVIGRATQGVRLIRLDKGDKVTNVAIVSPE